MSSPSPPSPKSLSAQLADRLLPLVLMIGILIGLAIPAVYLKLETDRSIQESSRQADRLAFEVRKMASEAGNLWKYQSTKYREILQTFARDQNISEILVFDEKGEVIDEYQHTKNHPPFFFSFPLRSRPSPILSNNRKIGEIIVVVSAHALFLRAVIVLLSFATLGFLLAFLVYRFPLRIVRGLEKSLLAYQEQLEAKVEERTASLNRATQKALELSEEAQTANRAKSQFLANMSHEIRTPMNGVMGMTELLSFTELNEEQRNYVDTLRSSGETLMGVLNDILDFSKIESGNLTLQNRNFDLRDVIQSVLRLFAGNALQKKIALTFHIEEKVPLELHGARDRLKQILTNLIGNAIKFTEKGKVHLEVSFARGEDPTNFFHFEVTDTGIGILPKDFEKIFKPFSQADESSTRVHGGTGLGLTISRELAERMGGTLSLTTSSSEGSTFGLILPFALSTEKLVSVPEVVDLPMPTDRRNALHRNAFNSPYILVAEDNLINQGVTRKMLELLGCRVHIAKHGGEAVQSVAKESFDLILMDYHMPILDGLAATRMIREMEKRQEIKTLPIIALTARAMEGDREKCLESGMDDYLSKPFDTEDLLNVLKRWLPNHLLKEE